jgi:hypothetical protein
MRREKTRQEKIGSTLELRSLLLQHKFSCLRYCDYCFISSWKVAQVECHEPRGNALPRVCRRLYRGGGDRLEAWSDWGWREYSRTEKSTPATQVQLS